MGLLSDLRSILPAAKPIKQSGGGPVPSPASLRGKPELIRAAVAAIPNLSDLFPGRQEFIEVAYAIKAAVEDEAEAFDIFGEWSARWDMGLNDPEDMALEWRRMKPPYRRGANWLFELAQEYGGYQRGAEWFDAEMALQAIEAEAKIVALNALHAQFFTPEELDAIGPRQWLYGTKISRRYVTMIVSPPGVGKSSFTFAIAIACAINSTIVHDKPHKPLRVLMLGLEDDRDELGRRFNAAMRFYAVDRHEVTRAVAINSGRDRPLLIFKETRDGYQVEPDYRALCDEMRAERFDLVIVDPFKRSVRVAENDNDAQDEVLRLWSQIAEETNAGVVLVSHTRKGAVGGDLDSIRGGSAQGGAARSVLTLSQMTTDEAKTLSIPEEQRRLFVRIDDAKNNMAPPPISAEWVRLQGVPLRNGTADYPAGDNVQVAVPWSPPTAQEALADENGDTTAKEAEILSLIEAGMSDGERYSAAPNATNRWAGKAIMERLGCGRSQAIQMIAQWLSSGRIEVREYDSPTRHTYKGLFIKRPLPLAEPSIFD